MSDDLLHSFKSSIFYFRIGVFCMLISYLIDKDNNFLKYFYFTLIITFTILIIFAFIEFTFKLNSHPTRMSSLFGDELILGSYLSRLLPLIIALFFIRQKKSSLEKNLFILFLVFTYFTILLSGERSAFFYVNLSFLFILFFVRVNLKLASLSLLVFSILLTFFILTIDTHEAGKNLFNRYKSITSSMNLKLYLDSNKDKKNINTKVQNLESKETENLESKENDDSNFKIERSYNRIVFFTAGHESLYKTAFNMFLDRPIIGQGPKMFRIKCNDPNFAEGIRPCMTHPHNFYIQLLAETGIIGFSFLFFLFIYLIYVSTKYSYFIFFKKKKIYSNYQICLLACLLITIWPIVPNGNFFNNYLMMIYCLPIGFFKKELKLRNI